MSHVTFTAPDLTTFCCLDELGLEVVGQHITAERAVVACRVVEADDWCHRCGCQGVPRDTVGRRLAHTPWGHRPTILQVRVRRYRCTGCGHVWRQDTSAAAEPRATLSRGGLAWGLEALVLDHLPVSRIAASLGVDWTTANDAVLAEGRRLLIDDRHRFDGVEGIGVDEHVWRHTRGGDKYVTVIIDLTPLRDGTGASRLLDMVAGRSKKVFKTWLAGRDQAWRDRIEVVAMDGFTGFKTAAAEELPDAVEVMDPFHVVQLAGDQLDVTRQRVQQDTTGHRGRRGDPLFGVRLTLHTGRDLLTDRQAARLDAVLADDAHAPVQVTWAVYQEVVAAYRAENRAEGRAIMAHLIDAIATKVPAALPEVITLGHTLKKRAADILAYFDHPGTSNGPSEAINGRLEHLRGIALGFRNLTHYITRSLLETGGFRPRLHPGS
ncbi:Transposase [Acidipropionibacterium acidipropionici ATCC 4875]|uniref:Transposase n=1 Tax=Acidipropionibacterium acidipropionici (strain ATCC 4875 / DSM 20272 / JCM 6432 / NBRC 12425 / NCIMB 8070 / 4) TaxID=1171373 RepID=K7RPC3_ACIA4|nr:ISL3 family transposase [Acidipropionibacterium acidipropionici]AFV88171.1 Transposase [Acidipropionibacterium acidipropionici ATCC 4875]